ncbi:MAG: HD domain-containing protein, partial [Clostridia bacterium]|nr:HD domain-containing protein [Clostridia bacterium]
PGSAGIYVARKDALLSGVRFDYVLLDHKAGLDAALTENAWNALTEDKDLYLSTDSGVVRMNLDTYRTEKRTYRLMVSEIKLDGRSVPIERGSGLTIDREVGSIEFVPEVVNYSLEDPKISYYLEGIDSGYTTVAQSELESVVYTNLPFGEYTFHLAMIDEDTGEIREESTYGFVKEKSIHDNDWFLIYVLLVGGLFVGWLTWFITRISVQQTIAIQQERLALALKQVRMGNETILAIAKTVDAKDVLTSKHSQRVSEYSVLIAKKIGFSEDERENLRKAALLHDIGKIGIPESILNKPERLTDREYAIMKTHVTSGADILKDFTLIEHVVEGAKYHHERFDGNGYPDGLKGKNIPLYGRIIAIADAFDAMTANRVYRKRLDFAEVLRELKNGRGSQFDPELLDVFLEVIDNGEIDVNALYADPAEENGEEKTDE